MSTLNIQPPAIASARSTWTPELLERDGELVQLESLLREARGGEGKAVVIEAEAGLGKTRLLQRVRRHAAQVGVRPLSARATELEREFPYGVVRRAAHELEAAGEKLRRYTPIGVEALTPSERRIADMAARGMTNREIATTLYVTIKTVESHLHASYDKLGIRSRRDLPDALSPAAS